MFDETKYRKEYREKNREKLRQYHKKWCEANPEKVIEYSRTYRKENAAEISQRAKAKRANEEIGDKLRKDDRIYRQSSVYTFLSCKFGHLKKERHRNKKSEKYCLDITLEYLLKLWDEQNHKCAISGKEMSCNFNDLFGISVDRIDPAIGYVEGNVQLVCQGINFAKNKYTNDEMLYFWSEQKSNINTDQC